MYYIFSDDRCGFCPEVYDVPKGAPVSVIAVANHASFHMLSYLLDTIDIGQLVRIDFVDVNEAQLEHHARTAEAIKQGSDRLNIVERMLGVKFTEEELWDTCDVSKFTATTGVKWLERDTYGLLVECSVGEMHTDPVWLELAQEGPSPLHHRSRQYAGYHYGFLREKENLRPNIDVIRDLSSYTVKSLADFCDKSPPIETDEHTFVWCSNIMSARTFRQEAKRLAVIGRWPRWHLWKHTPGDKRKYEGAHRFAMDALREEVGHSGFFEVTTDNWITYRKFGSDEPVIVLHILLGHGMPIVEFERVYHLAINTAEHVFVMEHNSESVDRRECFHNFTMTPDDICDLINVKSIRYVPGAFCNRRNFIVTCK